MNRLIITNGSSAAHLIRESGIAGHIEPWDDVLHDGPVPGGLPIEELSTVRARFLSECGWGTYPEIRKHLADRDEIVSRALSFNEIVLWFEHDLYDQLQLLQALSNLGEVLRDSGYPSGKESPSISLVCYDHFIGFSDPDTLRDDFRNRTVLTKEDMRVGSDCWDLFRNHDPRSLLEYLPVLIGEGVFRFLPAAILRWCEEFPHPKDGLTRTERTILDLLSDRPHTGTELFHSVQSREEAEFLGDASFWIILDRVTNVSGDGPVSQASRRIPIEAVSYYPASRWMGGVHLRKSNRWTFDPVQRTFHLNQSDTNDS